MSARWSVDCPKCGEQAGHPCRTLTTGRVTDAHSDRMKAWYDARYVLRSEDES